VGPTYPGDIAQPTDGTSGWVPTFEGAAWYVSPHGASFTSYLEVPNAPIPGTGTYAAWVILPATLGATSGLFCTTNSNTPFDGTHDRDLYLNSDNTVSGYIFDGATKIATSTNTVAARGRYLFVMVIDGANLTVYVNGQQWAQTAAGAAYAGYTTPYWYLGTAFEAMAGDHYLLSGAIWNRPLSPSEVLQYSLRPWSLFVPPIVERAPAAVTQLAVPISDVSAGSWTPSTGTDLYATLDEATASDSDYDQSATTPSSDAMEVRLTALTDPTSSTGHTVRYRAWKNV